MAGREPALTRAEGGAACPPARPVGGVPLSLSAPAAAPATAEAADDSGSPAELLVAADLNRVSEDVLVRAKRAMDVTFAANVIKPGDARYVHDKRVEFAGEKETNEWDESLSEVSDLSEDEFAKELAMLAAGK